MKKQWFVALLLALIIINVSYSFKNADVEVNITREVGCGDSLILVFAGDIMGHMPQIDAAYNKITGEYDFNPCFAYLASYIQSADLAIANLEVPLAGKPYSGYPCFSSPDALLDASVNTGFDIMQLANNHVADRGTSGMNRTYKIVNKKFKSIGVYQNSIQRDSLYPLLVDIKGLKIALLNCTFGTNGHAVPKPYIVNVIDTTQIKEDINKAKKKGAQCIIMTIHWGNEYELKANTTQEKLAKCLINAGVDLIIGSHPHVVQNFQYYYRSDSTKVPVFYSVGNMISNQRWRNSNGGILAKVILSRKTGKMLSCSYLPFYVFKGNLSGKFQYYLIPTDAYLHNLLNINLPQDSANQLRLFDSDTKQRLYNLPVFR